MLYWPFLSRFSASRKLLGGMRRKSSVAAAWTCCSFRIATRSMLTKRGGRDVEVSDLGHLAILFSPIVADHVATFLAEPQEALSSTG